MEATLEVPGAGRVGTLLLRPENARAALVLAHGAGAGMSHPFLAAVARRLADRGVATLRYQFPYMERGQNRTDPPAIATAAVRAAAEAARERLAGLPLFAGGKSFGGRMTSTAQADAPLPQVRGIVLLGFPLHPPGKPGAERAEHLARVAIPMLFLQGTRDTLAATDRIEPVVRDLGARASLHVVEGGDHSFHVPRRSGRGDEQVLDELADATAGWIGRIAGAAP